MCIIFDRANTFYSVTVRNLESQPKFNGRIGTITGQKDSYGFYPICLDTTSELKGSITCLPNKYFRRFPIHNSKESISMDVEVPVIATVATPVEDNENIRVPNNIGASIPPNHEIPTSIVVNNSIPNDTTQQQPKQNSNSVVVNRYSTANNGCVIASIIIFALIAAVMVAVLFFTPLSFFFPFSLVLWIPAIVCCIISCTCCCILCCNRAHTETVVMN